MKITSWREFIENEAEKPYFKKLWQKVEHERASKEIFPARK